jgi:4a-hydroxytetrahydrobiopterin dehydratase
MSIVPLRIGRLPTGSDITVDHGRYIHPMATDITQAERDRFISEHTGWHVEGETITKTFAFDDFNAAMGFVTRIALAAEVADHHPDIDIRWNKVTVALTTHSEEALTSKDLHLAAAFDDYDA